MDLSIAEELKAHIPIRSLDDIVKYNNFRADEVKIRELKKLKGKRY
jgi:hypothetical protein